jgi:hypothetical protein
MVEQIVRYLSGKALGKDLALTDLDAPRGGTAPDVI